MNRMDVTQKKNQCQANPSGIPRMTHSPPEKHNQRVNKAHQNNEADEEFFRN
jgi:hypothetical protein